MSITDQVLNDTQQRSVPNLDRQISETQLLDVPNSDPRDGETQSQCVSQTIADLSEEHKAREDFFRAALRLNNQQCAIIRRTTGCTKGAAPKLLKEAFDQKDPETHTHSVTPELLATLEPLEFARKHLMESAIPHKKRMEELVTQLPVWQWAEQVRGLGAHTMGQIIAETGDLSNYDNPAKVWKRMGVGLVVYPCPKCRKYLFEKMFDENDQSTIETQPESVPTSDQHSPETQCGPVPKSDQSVLETQTRHVPKSDPQDDETQRTDVPEQGQNEDETQRVTACKTCKGLGHIKEAQGKRSDKKLAELHGYNPRRRSVLWNIGACLIRSGGDYYELYVERKSYERQTSPDLSDIHTHRRAQRWMEKRLLKDLWVAWNGYRPGDH